MTDDNKPPKTFIGKYLSLTEIIGWLLCITSMVVIVFAKSLDESLLPFAWGGAIVGAGIIGWGTGKKHRR